MDVYGIDLGTTNCCIAKINAVTHLPEVLPNVLEDSSPTIPSVVYFRAEKEYIVGKQAKEYIGTEPEHVVQFVKRDIGEEPVEDYTRTIYGRKYDPVTLSSFILTAVKNSAEASEGLGAVRQVVITVPAYFDQAKREATVKAGQAAGFEVLATINEPTAAALSYIMNSADQKDVANYFVYDLGGGTFDVTLLQVRRDREPMEINVIASNGNSRLGGVDWDIILMDLMKKKIREENGIEEGESWEEPADLTSALAGEVESLKIHLSHATSGNAYPWVDGVKTKITVTREEFENATLSKVKETMDLVDRVLKEAEDTVKKEDINLVLLVGGSTLMPMIQHELMNMFGADKVRVADPAQAVAKGAALWATMLVEDTEEKKIQKALDEFEARNGRKAKAEDWPEIWRLVHGNTEGPVPPVNYPFDNGSGSSRPILYDRASSSFGPCVLDRGANRIVDNVILTGDCLPIEAGERIRTYYVPRDNMPQISLHVYENRSKEQILTPVSGESVDSLVFESAVKAKHLDQFLTIPLPPNVPEGTEVLVEFTAGADGSVHMSVSVPAYNIGPEPVDFSFVKADTLMNARKAVEENRFYTDV